MNNFYCDKCDFECKFFSRLKIHEQTILHQTGKKKQRSDFKGIRKCDKCDYQTEYIINLKKHILNSHATRENREKEFKFFCKLCDFGTFSVDMMKIHKDTKKRKKNQDIIKS